MKRVIAAIIGLLVLVLLVNVGLILIDDGSPPETLKEYAVHIFGVLSVMLAIPLAKITTAILRDE